MLHDRLVCGCRDKRLQRKLLEDSALTFATALTLAKSNEAAERGAKDLSGGSEAVHHLNSDRRRGSQPPKPPKAPSPPPRPCSRCGALHSPSRTPLATTARSWVTSHRSAARKFATGSRQRPSEDTPATINSMWPKRVSPRMQRTPCTTPRPNDPSLLKSL